MNNNRGQTLVLFVLIIPILLLVMLLVVDIGNMIITKEELSGINNIALSYGLDNLEMNNVIDEMNDIVLKNDKKIVIDKLEIIDDKIYITTKKKNGGVFLEALGINAFDIKVSYVGYIENNKKKIERNN